ncbi:uncharacterized protein [Clytia hemisphaerica]|uniref:BTB domain-containing protein n=1 Tax=Clytia hemisphaerica TaxID=252671 RepID=A0A7M5V367_9CNID
MAEATSQESKKDSDKIDEKYESPFSSPWKGSDAVLVVEGKDLYVHTQTLSLASEVFEAMFNGNFKEAQNKKVNLEGKCYVLVVEMLRFLYPSIDYYLGGIGLLNDGQETNTCQECKGHFPRGDKRRQENLDKLLQLYYMSEEYMLHELQQKILQQVLQESLCIQGESVEFIIGLMKMADTVSNSKAVDNCLVNITKTFKGYTTQRSYRNTFEGIDGKIKDKNLNFGLKQKVRNAFLKKHASILRDYKPYFYSDKKLPDELKNCNYAGYPFEFVIRDLEAMSEE